MTCQKVINYKIYKDLMHFDAKNCLLKINRVKYFPVQSSNINNNHFLLIVSDNN